MNEHRTPGRIRRTNTALLVASMFGIVSAVVGLCGVIGCLLTGHWLLGAITGVIGLFLLTDHLRTWRRECRLWRLLAATDCGWATEPDGVAVSRG